MARRAPRLSARRATASASRIVTVLFMQVERDRLRGFVRPDERGVMTYTRADGGTTARGLNADGRYVRRTNPARAAEFSRRARASAKLETTKRGARVASWTWRRRPACWTRSPKL